MSSENFRSARVDQLTGLVLQLICDQVLLPAKICHLVVGYQGNMGQSHTIGCIAYKS